MLAMYETAQKKNKHEDNWRFVVRDGAKVKRGQRVKICEEQQVGELLASKNWEEDRKLKVFVVENVGNYGRDGRSIMGEKQVEMAEEWALSIGYFTTVREFQGLN